MSYVQTVYCHMRFQDVFAMTLFYVKFLILYVPLLGVFGALKFFFLLRLQRILLRSQLFIFNWNVLRNWAISANQPFFFLILVLVRMDDSAWSLQHFA